jgi:hypothetical protein
LLPGIFEVVSQEQAAPVSDKVIQQLYHLAQEGYDAAAKTMTFDLVKSLRTQPQTIPAE